VPEPVSIVIPFYNEAGNVRPLCEEIARAFECYPNEWKVILVDDGSTDGTWQEIRTLCVEHPWIQGLRHRENRGQSTALSTGFRSANSAWICTVDGDGQNDPAELRSLLELLDIHDFVSGHRVRRNDSWIRRVSSRTARKARKWVLGRDFADTGCALRAFRRKYLEGIFLFDGFHRFLPILMAATGARCVEVPCGHRQRNIGVSKYGVWNRLGRGLWDLVGVTWILKRRLRSVEVEGERGSPSEGK
jgi:dolichol-phosphate mannosyltransferase